MRTPAIAGAELVDQQCGRDDRGEPPVAEPQLHHRGEDQAKSKAREERDLALLPQQREVVRVTDLSEREAAHHQREYLRAGVAAHAGDDRHQHGQRDDLLDRAFELATSRRQERGAAVDGQPQQSTARRARGTGLNKILVSSRPAAESAWCSAWLADDVSTTSSMVMRPSRMLPPSTNGALTQSWSENWRATFRGGLADVDRVLFVVDEAVDRRRRLLRQQVGQRDAALVLWRRLTT